MANFAEFNLANDLKSFTEFNFAIEKLQKNFFYRENGTELFIFDKKCTLHAEKSIVSIWW